MHSDHKLSNRDTFLKEAEVMMKLNHHCIVRLIGISENASGSLMVSKLFLIIKINKKVIFLSNNLFFRYRNWFL